MQKKARNDQTHNEQQENDQLNMEVDELYQEDLHDREVLYIM